MINYFAWCFALAKYQANSEYEYESEIEYEIVPENEYGLEYENEVFF